METKALPWAWLLVVASATLGCASTEEITRETNAIVARQWDSLEVAPTLCPDAQESSFLPATQQRLRFAITEGCVREFQSGRSYFRNIALASLEDEEFLVIKAHVNNHRKHGLPYIFRPAYDVLNERREVVSSEASVPLCYTQGWSQRDTGYFGLIKLRKGASWGLVVYTSSENRGTPIHFGNQATAGGGGVVASVAVDYDFPAAPVGEVEIIALDQKLRAHLGKRCASLFR